MNFNSTIGIFSHGDVAQAMLAQAQQPGGGGSMLLVMVLMFAGMYFLIIAPQRKKQKEDEKMRESLKQGDKVVTLGGIYGTVVTVKKDRVSLRVDEGVKMEFAKHSIGALQSQAEEAKETDKAAK